jgi:hypothetical protein
VVCSSARVTIDACSTLNKLRYSTEYSYLPPKLASGKYSLPFGLEQALKITPIRTIPLNLAVLCIRPPFFLCISYCNALLGANFIMELNQTARLGEDLYSKAEPGISWAGTGQNSRRPAVFELAGWDRRNTGAESFARFPAVQTTPTIYL